MSGDDALTQIGGRELGHPGGEVDLGLEAELLARPGRVGEDVADVAEAELAGHLGARRRPARPPR